VKSHSNNLENDIADSLCKAAFIEKNKCNVSNTKKTETVKVRRTYLPISFLLIKNT
jgi:hypothetical protein